MKPRVKGGTAMLDKRQIALSWYRFWKNWHYAKFYYYGSERHKRKMIRHDEKINYLQERHETSHETIHPSRLAVRRWNNLKKLTKKISRNHKPAEE